jgi:hypothetical protein
MYLIIFSFLSQRDLLKCRSWDFLVLNVATDSEGNHLQNDSTMKNQRLGVFDVDPLLTPYADHLNYRYGQYIKFKESIKKYEGGLDQFSSGRPCVMGNLIHKSMLQYKLVNMRLCYFNDWCQSDKILDYLESYSERKNIFLYRNLMGIRPG